MNKKATASGTQQNINNDVSKSDECFKAFLYKLNHYGYTSDEFNTFNGMIRKADYENSKAYATVFLIFMFIFTIVSFMGYVPERYMRKYLLFFFLALLHKFITYVWDKTNTSYMPVSIKYLLILIIAFGIVESVYDPFVVATAILPIFILSSTLCAGSFFEYTTMIIVSLYLFIHSSMIHKEPMIVHGDIINGITFGCVSIVMHYYFQRTRLSRFFIHYKLDLAKRDLSIAATYDRLSGALNRGAFTTLTNRVFAMEHDTIAVCLLDLDNFKFINDNYGHETGDYVIEELGKSIMKCLNLKPDSLEVIHDLSNNANDYFGRLGGDEFFIILRKNVTSETVCTFVEKLKKEVEQIQIKDNYKLFFSMGIVMSPPDSHDFHEAYANADKALYDSKNKGKNCHTFYSS
ncbi:GGDEF domain-containing protein [Oribacterium sp. WCC10]|uniref:GGDEF domain-containing protein n=1 Tax=Oribacterium sp. WCC10 TaxID=1855343 RepID=UPI0008E4E363|nr:GGDEF domain-containing protein [Oribacterium sp. WCC10]SFG79809.1 diguanylate cyclase (GGDEF) domain-containing protein [Oribacterium sp. WCC10]